jgi:3-oxoacyl-[acyl-carrier protein] reductase
MSGGSIDLAGRVSLVTGASRGIGRATALLLAEHGSDLVLAARDRQAIEEVAGTCEAKGVRARPVSVDVADPASVREGVDQALRAFGRIDHLVNNAGVAADGLLVRMKREDWERVLQVNLTGAFEVTRAALPGMLKARYGRIVNVSSVVGLMGNPGQANYCAAKAGLMGFTRALAREVASRQITVNAVAPGFIDTEMTRAIAAEARERMTGLIPLGRLGSPEDVAAGILFLVGPGAAYITGEVLNISGGLYM